MHEFHGHAQSAGQFVKFRYGERDVFAGGFSRRYTKLPDLSAWRTGRLEDHRNVFPIPRVWQTYRTQNPVLATACGFKSHLRYWKP